MKSTEKAMFNGRSTCAFKREEKGERCTTCVCVYVYVYALEEEAINKTKEDKEQIPINYVM